MGSFKEATKPDVGFSRRTSERIDNIVGIFSPKKAYLRRAYRFSYDAIDSHRLRKKRTKVGGGTGDTHLSETNLFKLREIHRELCRNNPLIEGMFETERDGIIGSGPAIQARTGDDELNTELEEAWKETMQQRPCDITGRFSFDVLLGMLFLTYRRDGDGAVIFVDDKLQMVEGEQIGTPYGQADPNHYDIINGVAFSKKTKKLLGYYIGESDRKWGYIKPNTYKKYPASMVHHMFNPRRISQSRGKPALTSAIDFIDKITGYVDAELVRKKVNACFSMFIETETGNMPEPFTGGVSSTGRDKEGNQLEHLEPGLVTYGGPGQKPHAIGQADAAGMFDPFMLRMLSFIGRPMCMPLMLITLDFAGATFMNARIAYQKVQDAWLREQDWVVKPFVSRVWRWRLQRLLDSKDIKVNNEELRKKIFRHEVLCKKWPYVDPWKEAKADEQEMQNGTRDPIEICARQGRDFEEVTESIARANEIRRKNNLPELPQPKPVAVKQTAGKGSIKNASKQKD